MMSPLASLNYLIMRKVGSSTSLNWKLLHIKGNVASLAADRGGVMARLKTFTSGNSEGEGRPESSPQETSQVLPYLPC